jgi:hypothetical protein
MPTTEEAQRIALATVLRPFVDDDMQAFMSVLHQAEDAY